MFTSSSMIHRIVQAAWESLVLMLTAFITVGGIISLSKNAGLCLP